MPEPTLAQLGVPIPFRWALEAVEQLDAEAAEKLVDNFTAAATFGQIEGLQKAVPEVFPPNRRADAERLVPALLSLLGQLRGTPSGRIAKSVSQSADLELSEEARTRLYERLLPLMASKALSSTANALELLTQQPRNFSAARVLTDIRPVFPEKVEDLPDGAVIVQTLQLDSWTRDGETESYHLAMDDADLQALRDAIDRAMTKTATLRRFLAEAGLPVFELDERAI